MLVYIIQEESKGVQELKILKEYTLSFLRQILK